MKANEYREIELTKGRSALVSAEDFDSLSAFAWYASNHGKTCYAVRSTIRNGSKKVIYMHRAIMGADGETTIDHINGNTLDNRRENLRSATIQQNCTNSIPREGTSSRFKGVYWSEAGREWRVQIKDGGYVRTVGGIANEETAARIYDLLAFDRWGEFARLNFARSHE